jgi:hypothetical protein
MARWRQAKQIAVGEYNGSATAPGLRSGNESLKTSASRWLRSGSICISAMARR